MPYLQFMQQAGIGIDWQGYARLVGELNDFAELSDIVTFSGMPMNPEGAPVGQDKGQAAPQAAPVKPPVTTRNYVRSNRPGATQQGNDETMAQMLLGGNPQPSQMANVARG